MTGSPILCYIHCIGWCHLASHKRSVILDSLLFLLESKLDSLPESELKVAQYILQENKNVIHQRVTEIAKATGSSTSAVVRLCKTLGIPGFQEMKIMLARDVFGGNEEKAKHVPNSLDFDFKDENQMLAQISNSSIESINDLRKMINISDLSKATSILETATFIHSFGIGLSSGVAFDFAHKMQRLGLLCGYYQETQMQTITSCNMKKGMVGMVISHSGSTPEMVRISQNMKKNGVQLITITGNPHGAISDLSDIILQVPLSEPLKRQGASSTRISQLLLIDMLFTLIIKHNPEQYMKNIEKTYNAYEGISR